MFRRCHSCGQEIKLETSIVWTMLIVSGTCPDGHTLKWQSQPMIKGMAAGNLLLSAAILLCGITFTGIFIWLSVKFSDAQLKVIL